MKKEVGKKNRVDEFVKHPKAALLKVAGPIVLGMLVQTLYNVVDTAFVGRLGPESIAALTFSFPIFFIFIAVNVGIGSGIGSQISRYIGAKNKTAAENTAMHGMLIGFSIALVMFTLGNIFLEKIFIALGAQDVLALSLGYMRVILFGIFFMTANQMISQIFSGQGDTKTAAIMQVSSLLLNIALDPIFIYVLGFGVQGAAIATVISMIFGTILGSILLRTKSELHIHPSVFHFSTHLIKKIFLVGIPASLTMLLMSIYFMFINKFVSIFGTNHVAAMGVASRVESIATMPIVGVSIALMTLVGMFYGAKQYDAMKTTISFAFKAGLVFTISMSVLFFFIPQYILQVFTTDTLVLELGKQVMRIWIFTWPFFTIMIFTNRILQGLGTGLPGLILNLIRVVGISIPASYIMIFVLGMDFRAVPIAMLLGVIVSSFAAVLILVSKMKKMKVFLETDA
jgi:putative MATE family efflux protein